jgi:hypothetical protein
MSYQIELENDTPEGLNDAVFDKAYKKVGSFPGYEGKKYYDEPEERVVLYHIDPQTPQSAKNKLFTQFLHDKLRYMANSIAHVYPKYAGICGEEELADMAFVYLYENMYKFKPFGPNREGQECVAKSYSYYGTILRNYYKTHSDKTYKHETAHSIFDNVRNDLESNERYSYEIGGNHKDIKYEYLKTEMTNRIRNRISNSEKMRPNDLKVGYALIQIFESWRFIYENSMKDEGDDENKTPKPPTDFYLKKKIFQIIKDITGLSAKDISVAIRGFGESYGDLFREHQTELLSDDNPANYEDEFTYETTDYIFNM